MAKDPGKGSGSVSKEDVTIASQLAGLISQMAMQSSRLAASFETQAEATAKMAENMKNMGTGDVVNQLVQVNVTLKEVAAALQNLNTTSAATFEAISNGAILAAGSTKQLSDAAKEATVAADRQKTSLEDLKERLAETGANALTGRQKMRAFGDYLEKEFPVAIGAALGALSGLKQGFRNIISLGKGIFGFGMTVGKALFGIGKSILSIPFKLLSGLTDMASNGGGISEYAQAINNLRKEFGALSGPVASTIISTAKEMKGFSVQGLSANQAFGNVAERMEQLIKLFSAGGPALQKLSAEFKDNGGAILGFQKGLGLSDEQMGSLAERVNIAGGTISDSLLDMTKQATHLGKEFGVDFKVISKGMAKATADFKSFGSMSQKQIGVAVTYFAKLGVQLDKVTGVMDSFNTFDDAAEKVSTLNQVFGVNVDAMKMMNAENPAERVSMLQKEFAKAGISGEKLTRAQRQLIAQNTGIEESAVAQALSSKNQSVSLDKITKAGDKAAKSEMNQAQALNKLADAMDRVLKSGDQKSGGFFDNFTKGFTDGIASTKEFREIMLNLRGALRVVYWEGVRLGKAFVEHFPGMQKFLGGLADLFKPEKFEKLASGVTDVFIGFFKDLESGKASFPDLMERLKKTFFDFFDSEKGAGQKTLGGFKKIMMAIQVILAGGVEWIMKTMSGFIVSIVNFIKNPTTVPGVGGMTDAAGNYLSPIAQAFLNGWAVLGPALKDLFAIVFDKMLGIVKEKMEEHKWKIALLIFGPVLTRALLGAGTAMIGKAIGSAITAAMGTPAIAAASSTVTQSITSLATGAVTTATVTTETAAVAAGPTIFARIASKWSGLTSGLAKTLGPNLLKAFKFAGIAAVVADAAINISSAMDKFDDKLQKEGFDPSTRKIAAGTVGLINTLTLGLLPEDLQALIATGVAKMSNFLEESLDKMFGPSLANSMKERLAAVFQIFGGLGDLIMGLWNGDSAKVEKGILAIGEGILKNLFYAFEFLYAELPKLILQLGVYLIEGFFRLQAWLSKKLANIFHALENIPIFGPLFGLIGDFFDKIGGVFTFIANMFGKLQNLLKMIDISGWAARGFDALKNLFKGGASEGEGFFSKLFGWFGAIIGVIEEPYKLLRKVFNIIFSWDTKKSFMENMKDKWDAIVKAFNDSADTIEKLFDKILDGPKNFWNWIKENFTMENFKKIGGQIVDGLVDGLKALKDKVVGKFKEPIEGIKTFLGIKSPSKVFDDMGGNMVDGLMISFIEMPKRLKEKFLEAIKNLDELVKEIGTAVTNLIKVAIGKVAEMFDAIIDGPIKTFPLKVEKAIVDIVGVVDRSFTVITQSVRINFNKVYDVVVEITDKIMSYFETNVPRGIAIFKNLRDGILDLFGLGSFGKIFDEVIKGIQIAMGKLADFGPFKAVLDIAKKVFKISSPSKAMEAIGNNVVLGMDVAMANLPKKAEKHFDATLAKAENFSNDMSAVAPGAQVAAVAPSSAPTASGPAPAGAAVTDVISQIAELGKAAAGAADAHKKIEELNNVAGLISAELLKFSVLLPYIVDPLKSMYKLIKAGAGEIAVGEMVKQFTGLLTGLSELGDVGRKIKDENLDLKIHDLNLAAGDPDANNGLQYRLHRTPEWWGRAIDGAKGIETLFKNSPAETITKTITDFTSLISALSELGDIGRKIKQENLDLKIYDLNMAAGDPDANDGLQYMLSRIPHHWRPIAKHTKTVHEFFSKEFSIAGLTETMNLTKTTMKGVSSAMTGATGPTLQAMSDMASALVAIDEAVTKTKNINLSATLEAFKTNFGMALGQKGSHVVQAKDVTINVNFVVAIDATKLEGAILASKDSKIKEKINLVIGAIGQIPGKEVGLNSPENGPSTAPFAKIHKGTEGLP